MRRAQSEHTQFQDRSFNIVGLHAVNEDPDFFNQI